MVRSEAVGEVRFDPIGHRLLVEKFGPYESSPDFSWEALLGRERSKLWTANLDRAPHLQQLLERTTGPTWFGSYSPRGSKVALAWMDGEQVKAGVYDFNTQTLKTFDFPISTGLSSCSFDCPSWLSEEELIHFAISPQLQARQRSLVVYTDEMTHKWAQQSWRGKEPTVQVLGSRHWQGEGVDASGTLVKVNGRTGKTIALGEGWFFDFTLSPDRRRLAVLRNTGTVKLPLNAPVTVVKGAAQRHELLIYDFSDGGKATSVCPECNVTPSSLKWSPSSDRLFFGARSDADEQKAWHAIYDVKSRRLDAFRPRNLDFQPIDSIEYAARYTPFDWLGDTPVVRIATGSAANPKRVDWFAVPAGRSPINLTAKFTTSPRDYLAIHKGHLYVMAEGDLWRLSPNGTRQNLTQHISEILSPWCSVKAYWRDAGVRAQCSGLGVDDAVLAVDADALERGWLTFQTLLDEQPTGLLFLNVETGAELRIVQPSPDFELMAASAVAQAAVYRRKNYDGDHLVMISGNGASALDHFNTHLQGVVGGTPVMLTRREGDEEEDRIDWLLLPPNHRPGDRHPLLVYFYPDTQYSKSWRSDDLRDVSFLNQHIPAAYGYAVLLASMKIPPPGKPGDPLTAMHEQLIHAAENAVAAGYADPERWALMGHSYGGYGVLCVITQTQRFKAAIALAATTNLTSAYAHGMSVARATTDAESPHGVKWSEGGQGRMGAPPWMDVQRYVRNSPLFYADRIQTPLLLVHGDYDFVNVSEAEQMFNALHRQGRDALFLRYWGEEHTLTSPANMRDLWQRTFAWLDFYLTIPTLR